jgi:hypothetical protein
LWIGSRKGACEIGDAADALATPGAPHAERGAWQIASSFRTAIFRNSTAAMMTTKKKVAPHFSAVRIPLSLTLLLADLEARLGALRKQFA